MKILIVDDEEKIRELYSDFLHLRPEEKVVSYSSDGREALLKCLAEKFDVIFLDYKMPLMNGLDLLTVLRGSSLNKHTPVIMISGEMNSVDVAPELMTETYFLSKPVNFKTLGEVMTSIKH